MKRTPKIRVIATKVTGGLHRSKLTPCQDFYHYACSGNKLVAVVSDGAGSAKYGKIGAKIVCETLVDLLINAPIKDVKKNVQSAIEIAREKLMFHRLNKSKTEEEILNFSATIVGAVYHRDKGIFFHIGDGAGIALYDNSNREQYVVSMPANGCFDCETYFYTMNNWKECLRFTEIGKAKSLFLMTDGVTQFALSHDDRTLKNGFILPINQYLLGESNKLKAMQALNNTLDTKQARKLNSDDKTFLWAAL